MKLALAKLVPRTRKITIFTRFFRKTQHASVERPGAIEIADQYGRVKHPVDFNALCLHLSEVELQPVCFPSPVGSSLLLICLDGTRP